MVIGLPVQVPADFLTDPPMLLVQMSIMHVSDMYKSLVHTVNFGHVLQFKLSMMGISIYSSQNVNVSLPYPKMDAPAAESSSSASFVNLPYAMDSR